jgi:hypothetical protein
MIKGKVNGRKWNEMKPILKRLEGKSGNNIVKEFQLICVKHLQSQVLVMV